MNYFSISHLTRVLKELAKAELEDIDWTNVNNKEKLEKASKRFRRSIGIKSISQNSNSHSNTPPLTSSPCIKRSRFDFTDSEDRLKAGPSGATSTSVPCRNDLSPVPTSHDTTNDFSDDSFFEEALKENQAFNKENRILEKGKYCIIYLTIIR